MTNIVLVKQIQSAITDEIFYALGLNRRGILRRAFGWVFRAPTRRFARIMANVDAAVAVGGPPAGCQTMLNGLGVQAKAEGVDNIPLTGPAIILANHPGAYDSMAIGSQIPRTDLNVIVAKTRLYQVLPHIHPHMHYASDDRTESMTALRQAINHLKAGGILLQFGSGNIDPDPALYPVDETYFEDWSPSIEIIMRKVPEVQIVPSIASNVLLKRFAQHPLTRLRKTGMDRRRLAEFMQVIQQLLFPKSVDANPFISFGTPFTLSEMEEANTDRRIMPAVIDRMHHQLTQHLQAFESHHNS
jgi:hypothetical protein